MSVDPRGGIIALFVKVEGRGTALLGLLEPGETVQCTGPLGRPVELPSEGPIALLVRGAGAAAVVMLAAAASRTNVPVYTFLSASTAGRIVCREYLEPLSAELRVATDDGTEGYRGNATDLLDRLVDERRWRSAVDGSPGWIYTCGSRRFARHVQSLDAEGRAQGFVFLEGLMACGLGDCHGCAVRRKGEPGYYLVCRDGPHFPVGKVVIE
jgi:dihydroorotate dehydrogenase electron transfer subunit